MASSCCLTLKGLGKITAPLLFVLSFSLGGGQAFALEYTWEGRTYREVEVVSVEGDSVLLGTNRGEITVSRKGMTWQLEVAVKEFEKNGGTNSESRLNQNELPRAWLYGPVGSVKEDGITVVSSRAFVPATANRAGRVTEPKKEKAGAPVFTGMAFVRGVMQKEASQFDRVLWRDGFKEVDGRRMPAFSRSDPGPVPIPDVTGERVWANAKNLEMTAALKSVKEGKGLFVEPGGKTFVYEIAKLSEKDQAFVEAALELHAKALKQLKKDFPRLLPLGSGGIS